MSQQPTPEQLQAVLNFAATKLGTTPEALAKTVSNGGYQQLTNSLSPDNRRLLESMMNDPAKMQALLSSKQVQEFLKRLS